MKQSLILFFILLANSCFFAQENWTLKKDENGIKVYTRKTADSDIRELKAVFYIKAPLKTLVAVIDDWDNYPEWVYRCGKSSSLKKISETEGIHYQTVTAPWPVQNRDFIVNIKFTQDEKTGAITLLSTSKPDYIPVDDESIRVKKINSHWYLKPLKDGTVEVINQILVDPGGDIPVWLVNLAAVEGPYETMLHFKEMIKKKKYIDAKVPFVKESQ